MGKITHQDRYRRTYIMLVSNFVYTKKKIFSPKYMEKKRKKKKKKKKKQPIPTKRFPFCSIHTLPHFQTARSCTISWHLAGEERGVGVLL